MKSLFTFNDAEAHLNKLTKPLINPAIDFVQARLLGRQYAVQAEKTYGFKVLHESSINYDDNFAVYRWRVKKTDDKHTEDARTAFFIDANNGALKHTQTPKLEQSGDIVTNWLFWLHMAKVWGLPMQIFVSFMGVVVSALSVTGVYIWWKKRKARLVKNTILQPKVRVKNVGVNVS